LAELLIPVIKYLFKKEINRGSNFKESPMITGLYGWAKK